MTNQDKAREAFERGIRAVNETIANGFQYTFKQYDNGEYAMRETAHAWRGYQAALTHQKQEMLARLDVSEVAEQLATKIYAFLKDVRLDFLGELQGMHDRNGNKATTVDGRLSLPDLAKAVLSEIKKLLAEGV